MNVQRSLPPPIPQQGALEQGTKPPTAPRAPQHKWLHTAPGVFTVCVCVFTSLKCVCTLDGLMQSTNSEYGSPYLAVCHIAFTFTSITSIICMYILI